MLRTIFEFFARFSSLAFLNCAKDEVFSVLLGFVKNEDTSCTGASG